MPEKSGRRITRAIVFSGLAVLIASGAIFRGYFWLPWHYHHLQSASSSALERRVAAFELLQLGVLTEDSIPLILQWFERQDPESILKSEAALIRLRHRAVPLLFEALKLNSERWRARMARIMAAQGRHSATVLAEILMKMDALNRFEFLEVFRQLGSAAVPPFIDLLNHPDPEIRRRAACSLGDLGPAANTAALDILAVLRDRDREVRWWAAWAAGNIRVRSAAADAALLRSVEDPDPHVRAAAAWALGEIAQDSQPAIVKLRRALGDADLQVRHHAAGAIEKLVGRDL